VGAGYTLPTKFLAWEVGREHVVNVLLGDGSVRRLKVSEAETTLRALITRNGGEKVDADAPR
jgi:hypothetical protein